MSTIAGRVIARLGSRTAGWPGSGLASTRAWSEPCSPHTLPPWPFERHVHPPTQGGTSAQHSMARAARGDVASVSAPLRRPPRQHPTRYGRRLPQQLQDLGRIYIYIPFFALMATSYSACLPFLRSGCGVVCRARRHPPPQSIYAFRAPTTSTKKSFFASYTTPLCEARPRNTPATEFIRSCALVRAARSPTLPFGRCLGA